MIYLTHVERERQLNARIRELEGEVAKLNKTIESQSLGNRPSPGLPPLEARPDGPRPQPPPSPSRTLAIDERYTYQLMRPQSNVQMAHQGLDAYLQNTGFPRGFSLQSYPQHVPAPTEVLQNLSSNMPAQLRPQFVGAMPSSSNSGFQSPHDALLYLSGANQGPGQLRPQFSPGPQSVNQTSDSAQIAAIKALLHGFQMR